MAESRSDTRQPLLNEKRCMEQNDRFDRDMFQAYGIVLWEIVTLGGFPYPTVCDKDMLQYLLDGNRLEKPISCSDEM
ncbi:hypothetical protein NECAME_06453 [Necator americanus]|uniref:Serine-threonine/tyrosine-protein kinase catalytic domain-containing protein n=1 Tax=Necator americanus TaxID=51031 RepID=W2TU45_NECAM|nr:hypothetical protein NECAME_06453 [Necator americanus]ETN85293.1 hypothetical protein NECAME_06453 [Necator americanus]